MGLQTDLVLHNVLAGKACPIDRLVDVLDVSLGGAELIVEVDDPDAVHRQFCQDKAGRRKEFSGMPTDLGNIATGFVPLCRPILEVTVETMDIVGRSPNRALEHMRNLASETIGAKADGVGIAFGCQHPVKVGNGKRGIGSEEPYRATTRISRYNGLQSFFLPVCAMDIAGTHHKAFQMAELVEHKPRVIAHAAEMAVSGRVLLRAMGRAA